MPKRLLLLSIIYTVLAVVALIYGVAVIPALLLLMLVLSIFARHQATGWILRGVAVFMLLGVSTMPYLLEQNPQLASQWQQLVGAAAVASMPSWLLFTLALVLTMLQLWLVLTPKVSRWFQRRNNFNIMS
ncbi:hypothetical protein HR45_07635 [Shewanella mangrovi]|uniref:Uncharacterized protein n=2 Tax=Shewanella mangrovi TaxID=1515746 RepID=A0A094JJY9_9GAMM|nr:hypothetical protein HR45_07635 [Shewanella mangrovi]